MRVCIAGAGAFGVKHIEGIATIDAIKKLMLTVKHQIRADYKFYSQDLINNLFTHPYTKIEFVQRDLGVSRVTATKYLDALAESRRTRPDRRAARRGCLGRP